MRAEMGNFAKLISIFPIMLISMGFVYWRMQKAKQANFDPQHSVGEAFANGIFLGAALFHMLPDASHEFLTFYPKVGLTIAIGISVASLVVLTTIDGLANRFSKQHVNYTPYLLTLLVSIHALMTGLALGLQDSLGHVLMILIAILVHKGSESFALANKVATSGLNRGRCWSLLSVFVLMTPLGIGLGLLLTEGSFHSQLHLEAIFNAIAAGTFLYIPLAHGLENGVLSLRREQSWASYLSLPMGLLLMGLLAFFV